MQPRSPLEIHVVGNLRVTGGVSVSARQLAEDVGQDFGTHLTDPRRARDLARTLRILTPWSRAVKNYVVFNSSSHRSLRAFSAIARAGGRDVRTLAYLHGGRMRDVVLTCRSAVLSSFDLVAVTNERLAEAVRQRGVLVQVATPFMPQTLPGTGSDIQATPNRMRILSTEFGGASDLYGTEFAIRAVQQLRHAGRSVDLTIVTYGPAGASRAMYRDLARQEEWFTLREDLSPEAMASVLSEQDIVLRLTSTDGDSLIVREALAQGCRVIASSTSPRPEGAELCEREPRAIVNAITSSDPDYASGRGLADATIAETVRQDIRNWTASW